MLAIPPEVRRLLPRYLASGSPRSAAASRRADVVCAGGAQYIDASVLVPLFERDGETWVWLLRRHAGLRQHGGQIAFPGGRRDPGDRDAGETALREAEEELALPRRVVELLGQLPEVITVSSFRVQPFVGWLTAPFIVRPEPHEVDRAFCVPLSLFTVPPRARAIQAGDHVRFVPSFEADGECVWGATARMLLSLIEVVQLSLGNARA